MDPHVDGFDPPFMTPEVARAIHEWQHRMAELQWAERQTNVHWAAMLCRCEPWYDFRYPGPPQAECPIHTGIAVNGLTGEWI